MCAQKAPIYAWIDETGNTGVNIFDEAQPDFLTAALITKGDIDLTCGSRLARLAARVGQPELHGNEMGIAGLEKISRELLDLYQAADAHFFLSRVEKKYLLCTKLFDTLFDSGENAAVACDLSPEAHPIGWRVRSSFEPNWLGGATGRGAEPRDSSSDPSRCMPGALSFANVIGGTLPRALCGLTVL